MKENKLSLIEKWNSDAKAYDNAKIKTKIPQCVSCRYYVKNDALHCHKYTTEKKPKDVLFANIECSLFESKDPLQIYKLDKKGHKIYGGIFGFCVGDMLGVPVEFSSRKERENDEVLGLRAYGTYHQPFGTWSDDTSLTLCLIDAIVGEFSIEKLKNNMIDFYQKGLFTPYGEVFDIGNSTVKAIENMISGKKSIECGGSSVFDNGNGSMMRILPLAFIANKFNNEDLIDFVASVSALTHNHARSKLACVFFVTFAQQLFNGKSKENAYNYAIEFIELNCKNMWFSEFDNFKLVFTKEILGLDKNFIKSSGYVIDTLEAVLWVFFHSESYREAVLKAVNLGGDTDTIAALVGGLSGIYYGFETIPNNWLQMVSKKEDIASLVKIFCKEI